MTEETNYLKTSEAAAWLGLSAKTLARYRSAGKGPVFYLIGERAVRYLREDLRVWLKKRRRVSTVDDGTVLPGAAR